MCAKHTADGAVFLSADGDWRRLAVPASVMVAPPKGPVLAQVIDSVYRADRVTSPRRCADFVAGVYHSGLAKRF